MKGTIQKRFPYRNKSFLVYIHLVCVGPPTLLPFFPMLSFTYRGAGTRGPGEHPGLVLCCSKRIILQIWHLMASLLTPKRTYSSCCYYHQLWPWLAKHFYFASCLNGFSFWHDSQIANRCFQLCPCLFCFVFNGLFPRWGFSLWQAASWLVIGMTFQLHYCLSHWQGKPTRSGFRSSKCLKSRGRQNNMQYGVKGRSFRSEMKIEMCQKMNSWIQDKALQDGCLF